MNIEEMSEEKQEEKPPYLILDEQKQTKSLPTLSSMDVHHPYFVLKLLGCIERTGSIWKLKDEGLAGYLRGRG